MAWFEQARCRGREVDLFFVRGAARARRAQNICGNCTVREQCLDYAMTNEIDFGVWGGLTERQRRAVARNRERRAS